MSALPCLACPCEDTCGGDLACAEAVAAQPCALAALPHDDGPDCDEWSDGRCHAACAPDMQRDYHGEYPHGGYVWTDDGDTCGPDCPRYEENTYGDD